MYNQLSSEEIEQLNTQSNDFWILLGELTGTCLFYIHPLLDPEIQQYHTQRVAKQLQLTPDKFDCFLQGAVQGYTRE